MTEHDVDDPEVTAEEVGGIDADQPADAPASTPTPSRSTAWIAWTLAAVLAVVAAVVVVEWRTVAGPLDASRAAEEAAVDYVLALSTWDASSGLEPTYAALVAGSSDEFLPEVDDFFGDQQREELVAVDAVSEGTIQEVLTGEPAAGTVAVVVVVQQEVVTGPNADPATRTERVALLRMVDQDGAWLVDDLEMLSELQLVEEDQ